MPSQNQNQRPPPPHWPIGIEYIDRLKIHSSVPKDIVSIITGSASKAQTKFRGPVAIRAITSPSHPANGQNGLFAAKKILPRTHIIEYVGEVHCDDRPNSDYDLSLYRTSEGLSVGIDASLMGNEARFVNDYRGIRSRPNAEFLNSSFPKERLRMEIWTGSETIQKGEEILVSYGKSWWRARLPVRDENEI